MAEAKKIKADDDSHQTLVEGAEVFSQSRTLRDLTNLTNEVIDSAIYLEDVGEKIDSGMETINYNIVSENSLQVGKESVQPLVELKKSGTEILAEVRGDDEIEMLRQEVNFDDLEDNLEELKTLLSETQQYTSYLNVVSDAIVRIVEQEKCEKEDENGSDSGSSIYSLPSSSCASSVFSLFDGNSSNVATSSPIPKNSQGLESDPE
ncbi:hypothetical protein NQ315_010253 [Exocentrus adspersus]|uniref:Uncharacterized protein n=1 Tax=Exocentrus adspersus TaxID=1586481 RepID=A0AAV8WBK1_9CUCU|nr:hypothetical protein NQ315_010253 [Exocentrus adspersus]